MNGHEIKDGHEYYICDTRQTVGNCVLWWGENSRGYVCELANAGIYSAEEAREKTRRDTDVPFERRSVESVVVGHVRTEPLYELQPINNLHIASVTADMGLTDIPK